MKDVLTSDEDTWRRNLIQAAISIPSGIIVVLFVKTPLFGWFIGWGSCVLYWMILEHKWTR